ncbi:unnamed protein product [Rotaria magnacalcarata]|uniref:Tyrosine-protein kinase n=1 Tax=Rotaria magnacalcarata TaxID=392030 RepID=A0A816NA91_9BILA|nr:unnamed protein product [Rotaria magnacalcarata]CAF2110441.1 unnamed protein product [Rotaria magnacalcarata]CAF4074820.1 unnamed protein product [Rotaria magnacalcarata]CAF4142711.1 unnamed protein product [Rotaria magnacalcarata]
MNSIYKQDQSITYLIKTHSLIDLLDKDHDDLIKQSYSISYYHPNIDRSQAEQLLKTKYIASPCDGLFLLRDCSASPYDFSLSLIYNKIFFHYKIQLIYDIYFSIDSGPQIAGIENLIQFYQERTDGLICILSKEFVKGQPPPVTLRLVGSTNTLHRACQQGNFDIVKKVLSSEYYIHRPDINAKDSQGSTALHRASFFGHDDIVRLLIKAGSHVLARDINGATILHRAAAGNCPSTLAILINEGQVDYEERNYKNRWVPLHEAAFYNSAACVQILLDCGAPLRPRTDQGKTPLELAEESKSDASINILRQYKTPPAKSSRLDWLHDQSNFDRLSAKQLMESSIDKPTNGMFIVRRSSANLNNYALTLFYDNDFFNFEIIHPNETTFYIDDGPFFDSLEHLVDHYCRIPDGLPTTLMCSVNRSKEIVLSRIQPFIASHMNNQTKDIKTGLKYNFSHQKSVEETKSLPNIQSSTHRSKVFSSLNSSMTSLNSLSSRSCASSVQENVLSDSSSSLSLSSPPSSSKPKISLIQDENPSKNLKSFVDRRNTVGGKIRSLTSDYQTESRSNQLEIPAMERETYKYYELNVISPDQIHKTAKLGEGEFGEVYEGFYREASTTIPVAIKVLKDYSYSAKQDFLREAEHMSKLNHHCICKLYGIVDSNDNGTMMMIIELFLFGSMLDYLTKYKFRVSEYRLKLWASQIADGMEYMESKGIIHRDLAARNILLQSTDQVKISDFGLSRCIDSDVYVQKSDSKIPVKWYAPEAISLGKFTSKSDVWSVGVTFWEMFSYGDVPYGDMSGSDVYYSLKHGKRLEQTTYCPEYMYQIMLKCWEWDEKDRPTFQQLVQLLKKEFNPLPPNGNRRKSTSIGDLINEQTNEQHEMNNNNENNHESSNITKL